MRAADLLGPESSASIFETSFEKINIYKSPVPGKTDPSRRQSIRL
jgi:hypothetical protein